MTSNIIPTIPDARFIALCDQVVERMDKEPVPGAVMGVWHDGAEQIAGFGVTSLDNPLLVTKDTLFQVGSITKTITATALMRLVEMGQLDLDKPVRAWMPSLRLADEDVAARVTLRHLLTHTAGWVGDYFNDYGPGPEALQRVIAKDLPKLPQITPLGEIWSYCNTAFFVAGRLLEIASGKTYEDAVSELVFKPLGMEHAFFFGHDVLTYRFVVGHGVSRQKPYVARPWGIGRAGHPVGGLVTTVSDLFRYAQFHLGDGTTPDGKRLLSREMLAEMQKPHITASGPDWMGLTWFITPLPDGRTIIRHGGATKGQMANLTFVPGENFAYAMFANSDDAEALIYSVRKAALKEYLGIILPEATPIEVPAEKLAEVAGRYDAAGEVCEIRVKGSQLELQVTEKGGFPTPETPPPSDQPAPARMAFYADDRTVVLEAPFEGNRCEFLRNPDGKIGWFRFGSRVHKREHEQNG